jgi:hypothetical protein
VIRLMQIELSMDKAQLVLVKIKPVRARDNDSDRIVRRLRI